MVNDSTNSSVWIYQPNASAPNIFMGCFFPSVTFHTWQIKRKSQKMTLLIPCACMLMVVGFAIREAASYYIGNLDLLISCTVFLLSGPPIFIAANFFILTRTIYYIPWLSPIHPGRILIPSLAMTLVIETLVTVGAAQATDTRIALYYRKNGAALVKTSLILQVFTILALVAIISIWQQRVKRAALYKREIRFMVRILYVSSALLMVQCIYRLVEYFSNSLAWVNTHEVFFYVFGALPIYLNTATLSWYHPSHYLPANPKVFLATDGITEVEGPGWWLLGCDRRSLTAQLLDPLDLAPRFIHSNEKGLYAFWNDEPTPEQVVSTAISQMSREVRLKAQTLFQR
ncbi:hypothetical protein M433DRAFT_380754 [Acidomyces richmondensis BFW]|nr:MAG: hypothetical protein FE78DRAFT_322080 [Acidomyces sp. 'richmondensis']KYG48839.1 hypothetical protein M433DRAFT_380754 [Acidomyces richmondensis BFW]